MKITNRNHVHRYVPNYLDNRRLPKERITEQIVVLMKVINASEEDDFNRAALDDARQYAPDKAQELTENRLEKLYSEKFVGVEGLEIEGLEGKEFDYPTFYTEAPPEIVSEVLRAFRSKQVLTAGEQKNFVPVSDGPSSAPAQTEAL
jgi:hypothetical protein